jgi:predicted Zn finger-like uncharacterized protein
LVVVCESCSTRFRVDESRIPPKGTLVRCSRCKATFIVKAEEPSFEETVQDVVAEVTEAGGQPVPEPSEDLFEQVPDELGTTVRGSEEDSWEFDEEPPDYSPPAEVAAARPEAAPPETDPLLSEFPEMELRGTAPPEVDLPDASPREPDLSDTGPPEAERAAAAWADALPEASNPALDELGSPDDWDLLGDSSIDVAASGATFEETPEVTPPAAEEALPASVIGSGSGAETQVAPSPPAREWLRAVGGRLVAAGRGALLVTAWAGVIAALGAGLLASMPRGPQALPLASTHELLPLPDGEARNVHVRFVENAFAGTLYVVQGELVRLAADPTLGLRVHWRDATGASLGAGVWAQSLPATSELRERAPEAWHQGRAGIAAAPARGAFAAIFAELPEAATGVALSLERLPASALPSEEADRASEEPGTPQPEPGGAAATAPSSPSPLPSAG